MALRIPSCFVAASNFHVACVSQNNAYIRKNDVVKTHVDGFSQILQPHGAYRRYRTACGERIIDTVLHVEAVKHTACIMNDKWMVLRKT